jgi:hypothetical protein
MAVAQVRGQLDAFDDEGLRTPRKEQLGAVRDVLARHGALIGGLDKIPKTVIAPELLKAIKEDAAEVNGEDVRTLPNVVQPTQG